MHLAERSAAWMVAPMAETTVEPMVDLLVENLAASSAVLKAE